MCALQPHCSDSDGLQRTACCTSHLLSLIADCAWHVVVHRSCMAVFHESALCRFTSVGVEVTGLRCGCRRATSFSTVAISASAAKARRTPAKPPSRCAAAQTTESCPATAQRRSRCATATSRCTGGTARPPGHSSGSASHWSWGPRSSPSKDAWTGASATRSSSRALRSTPRRWTSSRSTV